MRAMVLSEPGRPLKVGDVDDPEPGPAEVLVRVIACGVCRTDLHVYDAELCVADERFCMELPPDAGAETAPLLCAGMIGYRALRMCGDAERLGLYGFGASAHLVCQVAAHQGRRVFAITRAVEDEKRDFA